MRLIGPNDSVDLRIELIREDGKQEGKEQSKPLEWQTMKRAKKNDKETNLLAKKDGEKRSNRITKDKILK